LPETLEYRAPAADVAVREVEQRLPFVTRMLLVPMGVVLPGFGLLISLETYMMGPDWQDGGPWPWLRVMPGGGSGLAFLPALMFGWAALLWLVARPALAARQAWVRVGLVGGVITAAQFALQQAAATATSGQFGQSTSFAWGVMLNLLILLGGGMIAGAVLVGASIFADSLGRRRGFAGGAGAWAVVAIGLLIVDVAVLLTLAGRFGTRLETLDDVLGLLGGQFVVLLFGIPGLAFAAFVAACAFAFFIVPRGPSVRGRPRWQAVIAGLSLWLAGYAVAWAVGLALARRHYQSLPLEEPSRCYVVTAAARGPRWLTGGFPSEQLLRMKAAEHVLRTRHPATHRQLRRVYDAIGPGVARRLTHPATAGVAFVVLKPIEWGVVLSAAASRSCSRRIARAR
jgi:hypothetical protein